MATPYAQPPPAATSSAAYEMRSVTPATKNGTSSNAHAGARYPSAPIQRATNPPANAPMPMRTLTPLRAEQQEAQQEPRTPSSNGLIRLGLRKPMGIVFEPMYDPQQPNVQRGVRICDLPRTGAAALTRKLQVGDELLQINDTTVSRMTFDEIMDFIIEADPELVHLLFRRPRKETLQARQGVQQKIHAALNKDTQASTVKWVDEERKEKGKKKKKKGKRKQTKEPSDEETDTLQSSTAGEESYTKKSWRKKKGRRDPYESESFLDVLIDTICSNSGGVCRDTFSSRRGDYDEDYSDEEESLATLDEEDESTYVTYEESLEPRDKKSSKISADETEDETLEEEQDKRRKKAAHHHHHHHHHHAEKKDKHRKKYDDDTLETNESPPQQPPKPATPIIPAPPREQDDDTKNPAPIKEVEYDDRIDHGADVSVMESLGGPSLLIEKQRAAAVAATKSQTVVPEAVMAKFGLDYPANFGMTRKQTIEADPLKYYAFVVKRLLEEHEPEKVRLLDKLLAKYQGREDHLVQKLYVRYNHEENEPPIDEFTDAVKKSKASEQAQVAVNAAKERIMQQAVPEQSPPAANNYWSGVKEQKEPEQEDEEDDEEEGSVSDGSEYSRDSVDGTSPAVIAQVSELLNYVYGKTSVPGQIDRVSTIMRAYEGREAVLLELLETKALIKANKEKENADQLPSFLRNSQMAQKNSEQVGAAANDNDDLPPVTPMATGGTVLQDDISSMSGVSSPAATPAAQQQQEAIVDESEEVEVKHFMPHHSKQDPIAPISTAMGTTESSDAAAPKVSANGGKSSSKKPPATPDKEGKKKRGLFGGLFGKKKKDGSTTPGRAGSRAKGRRS